MKTKIIIFFTVCVSIISCKKIIDATSELNGKGDVKLEDFKTITVTDKYTMALPKYMSEMKSLNDDASLEYANIYKEAYTIVIDENKEAFVNAFKEIEVYNDSLTPLENYSDYQVKSIQESVENGDYKMLNTKIRNLKSNQYELTGKINNVNITYLLGFVESDNDLFIIMSWTLKDRFKKYQNTFQLMQNSFKLQ